MTATRDPHWGVSVFEQEKIKEQEMINLDNLKAGSLVTFVADEQDVENFKSAFPSSMISVDQITSISHPPKPLSKLQEVKLYAIADGYDYASPIIKLIDVLIEQQKDNDGKGCGG